MSNPEKPCGRRRCPRYGMQPHLAEVLSRSLSESSTEPGPPPDGGWAAWLQCKWHPSTLTNKLFTLTLASLQVLLATSGVGIVSRSVPSFIADCIGAVNVFMRPSIIASLLVYCFIAIARPVGLYACVLMFGVVGAGIQSLFPAVLSFLTTDLRKLGVSMGMVFAIVFAASPIAAGCDFSIAAKAARMPSKGLNSTSRIKKGHRG
ncbi:hypothetical protein G3M48_004078 [Beauveria asiatica]|uniref:Uncharacterized protein n=1 Tax=Beauveria asiatica TaxID=1069075 RepID=A0AAW0RTV5_9HYPO